ncbi:hypothetical protein AC249_AIPGENE8776, partial [Paramuricea clavata]
NESGCLLLDDIPGSNLDLSRLTSYRVDQLKFWLSCRGDSLKNLHTKAACVQRINNYVRNGQQDNLVDPTANQIYVQGKELQQEKAQNTNTVTNSNLCLKGNYWKSTNLEWSKPLLDLPTLTIKEIEQFFEESGKTGKPQKRADNLLYENFLDSRGMDKHAEKFVNSDVLKVPEILQKKFDHGKIYEPVALEKYRVCMREEMDPSTEVYPCGLVLNRNNCWLGSSPDGKVVSGDMFGIAECKCPEQYKHSDVFDVACSNESSNFTLHVENSKLQLRKTHPT